MPIKGYLIRDKNNNYYCGSKMGHKFSGFYGAKIYRSYKLAFKALQSIKAYGNFQIYEVEVTIKYLGSDEVVE